MTNHTLKWFSVVLWAALACYFGCTGHQLIGLLFACNAFIASHDS